MSRRATVYLVGAGPGDPGLITVAGAEALKRADVVVYDYLANPELLRLCPERCERVYVGKSGIQHTKTQDEINAILVEKAKAGMGREGNGEWVVVRLKGGDPYVFGRGGEEGEYLRANGAEFVEVPGITAGIGGTAYAGIPVTHRDFASTITLVTGHERDDKAGGEEDATRVNYGALAQLGEAGGTMVFYMGVKSLPLITERLMAGGLAKGTPAAVIRWGTRPEQRVVTGTVGTIVEEIKRAGITAPAITVIGKVVTLRETLNWFERRPLFGRKILVTRTRQQASELTARLGALGAQVFEAPTIEVVRPEEETVQEIDEKLQHLPAYDWVVFTSANGVRATWERLSAMEFDARHFGASNVAAVGEATAAALLEIGIRPDVLPEKFVGDELAEAIQTHLGEDGVAGKRFLLLRADIARPVLREALLKMGGMVEDVAVYETRRPGKLPEEVTGAIASGTIDTVTFTSGSTATNLWEMLSAEERGKVAGMKRASIGPVTTAALLKLGKGEWRPTVEAEAHTIEGLVEAIVAGK